MSDSEQANKQVRCISLTVIALAGAVGLSAPAGAASITVTTTVDELNSSPPCSLREAIRSANTDSSFGGCAAGSGPDRITLRAGTYQLVIPNSFDPDENVALTGDLDVVSTITLVGSGQAATIIDGNGAVLLDRVFDVSAAATAALENLTIRNGNTPTSAAG